MLYSWLPAASRSAFTRIHGITTQDRRAKVKRREQSGSPRFRTAKRSPRARVRKTRTRAAGEFRRVSSTGDRTRLTNGKLGANQNSDRSRHTWREYRNRAECESITAAFAQNRQ